MKVAAASMVLVAGLFAQSTPSADPYGSLLNLGIGALVAAPFVYLWRDERKQRIAADDRFRELLERTTEVLVEATQTLAEVQRGMADQVQRSQSIGERNQWDLATRRMELAAEDLKDEVRRIRSDRRT